MLKRRLTSRRVRILLPLLCIPPTVLASGYLPMERGYLVGGLLVAVLSLLALFGGIEERRLGTRRMVLVAALIALSVAGRFLPFFKPVTAIAVLAAVYLGGEAGFAVGALSALLSNFYFGQGPWTPFQMLAWGLIGLLAGVLSRPLQRHRVLLLLYGALSGVAFSVVMDVWTVLWYSDGFSLSLYVAALAASLPHTLIYALSNLVFLLLLARPFGNKLQRIKIKYGI